LAGFGVLEITSVHQVAVGWEAIGVGIAMIVAILSLTPSRRRQEISRATAVFGPDWRSLTKAERETIWRELNIP
jgi:hypothetical protein